ncbi:MAG TPA: hypothetical protein VMU34_15995 [Mycobacterium sp.]|nr:hypothetical protein [Mycobacterium sp.]
MGSLIGDNILEAFAVVAPVDKVAAEIRRRCGGVIDRVIPGFPQTIPTATVATVVAELRDNGKENQRR